MKKFTVVCDLHLGSGFAKEINKTLWPEDNVVFNGDCVERRWSLTSDFLKLIDVQKTIFSKFPCTLGNHDFDIGQPLEHQDGEVLFLHGHQISDSFEKYEQESYKNKVGTGYLGYWVMKIAGLLPVFKKVNPSELKRASDYAKMRGATTVCLAHFHPENIIDENVNGVRVIVCPRGITEIEL